MSCFYFFRIHRCKNSLSSLHISVHHCTFCASLHVKTIEALFERTNLRVRRMRTNFGDSLPPVLDRNRKLQTSKAPLKSQSQGTSLFTSAASNQMGFPIVRGKLRSGCQK